MTDGRPDGRRDGRTDGGNCNIPDALLKKHWDNKSTKALPKLCMPFHLNMPGTSCTDDVRV